MPQPAPRAGDFRAADGPGRAILPSSRPAPQMSTYDSEDAGPDISEMLLLKRKGHCLRSRRNPLENLPCLVTMLELGPDADLPVPPPPLEGHRSLCGQPGLVMAETATGLSSDTCPKIHNHLTHASPQLQELKL